MNDLNRKLKKVLLQDTRFLQKHGFLDYSLLVAVETSEAKFNAELSLKNRKMTRGLIKREGSTRASLS